MDDDSVKKKAIAALGGLIIGFAVAFGVQKITREKCCCEEKKCSGCTCETKEDEAKLQSSIPDVE
jgi:hypothetical protein